MRKYFLLFLAAVIGLHASTVWGQTKVALLKYNGYFVNDQAEQGLLEGLRSRGFTDGDNIAITFYNAEGDIDNAGSLAAEIIQQNYDLILTVTTPCLQAIANVNKETQIPHVFCTVSWAYTAEAGIGESGPLDKPAYMTGISSPNPIVPAMKLARDFNPELSKLGLIFNPAEANSAFLAQLAREGSPGLGIELLEENVSLSSEVENKANALTANGIDAFLMSGDNTVNVAIDSLVQIAGNAHIPIFSVNPGSVDSGALFDLGPNFYQVGFSAGDKAADILSGISPATIAHDQYVPEMLYLNFDALEGLQPPWHFSADAIHRADKIIGSSAAEGWELYP